jgi:hypothetical protein
MYIVFFYYANNLMINYKIIFKFNKQSFNIDAKIR